MGHSERFTDPIRHLQLEIALLKLNLIESIPTTEERIALEKELNAKEAIHGQLLVLREQRLLNQHKYQLHQTCQ
jgi:hypothetical protein